MELTEVAEKDCAVCEDASIYLAFIYSQVKYTTMNKVVEVNIDDVLACRWNMNRYNALCSKDIADIVKKSPPRVVAYKLKDGYIYSIQDGNHRVVCARHRGLKTIPVNIVVMHEYPTYPVFMQGEYLIANKEMFKIDDFRTLNLVLKTLQKP